MLNAIDISSLQPHPKLDGVDLVIIKASEGRTYANPLRRDQEKATRQAGKLVAWYHFLWPDNIQAQAEWFIKCADPKPGDVLACDWETTTSNTVPSCADKDAFLAAVKKLRPKLRVILYCNLDYWKRRDTTSQCGDGLWIADPGAAAGKPRVQHSWLIHQYGIRNHTDVNVVNFATVQAWKDWAGVPEQEEKPSAPRPTQPGPTQPAPKPGPYTPPAFPAGLAPGKSKPPAKPLQKALRAAGFLQISDGDLSDTYGPRTQGGVGRLFAAHPQFRSKGKPNDVAIGPKGWAFLFTLAYGRK
ncbi:GH25 family lysozyme [Streptomyces sp. NPDC002545]